MLIAAGAVGLAAMPIGTIAALPVPQPLPQVGSCPSGYSSDSLLHASRELINLLSQESFIYGGSE